MNRLIFAIFFMFVFQYSVSAEIYNDVYMDELLKNTKAEKPVSNTNYNYESTERIPIKLKINEKISTKKPGVYDNQPIELTVRNPVKYKNKMLFEKGAKFTANVAIYMDRGMNGVPAAIIVDNFKTNKIDSKKLSGVYVKRGLNLTPIVLPLKWALTPFPGVGSLTNFIVGGPASITPNDTITVYYYPEW